MRTISRRPSRFGDDPGFVAKAFLAVHARPHRVAQLRCEGGPATARCRPMHGADAAAPHLHSALRRRANGPPLDAAARAGVGPAAVAAQRGRCGQRVAVQGLATAWGVSCVGHPEEVDGRVAVGVVRTPERGSSGTSARDVAALRCFRAMLPFFPFTKAGSREHSVPKRARELQASQ